MVVVGVGGGEDDLLQAGVIPADVAWSSGHAAAKMAARRRRRHRLCTGKRAVSPDDLSVKLIQVLRINVRSFV